MDSEKVIVLIEAGADYIKKFVKTIISNNFNTKEDVIFWSFLFIGFAGLLVSYVFAAYQVGYMNGYWDGTDRAITIFLSQSSTGTQ